MKDYKPVTISNRFIEASYKIDAREKKVLTSMIKSIQDSEEDTLQYEFDGIEIAKNAGIPTRHLYRDLKEIAEKLTDVKVRYSDDEKEEFEIFRFIDAAIYKKGKIKFRISPEFKSCITELKGQFTQYLIENIKPMKSIYSIRLYELLRQYRKVGERKIKVEDLKKTLQAPENYEYKIFNRNILQKAEAEINKHTDLTISYKGIRKGRSLHTLIFKISTKDSVPNTPDQEPELPEMPPKPRFMSELEKDFITNKISIKQVREIVKTCDLDWEMIYKFWLKELKDDCEIIEPVSRRNKYVIKMLNTNEKSGTEFADFCAEETIRILTK